MRLRAIEDRLSRLENNPLGQAFSTTQSDGSLGFQLYQDAATGSTAMVVRQGSTTARDPSSNQHPMLMYVGEVFVNGVADDSTAIYFMKNGGTAAVFGGSFGTRIFDAAGNIVIYPDEVAGEGLATPWIPLPPPVATGTASWPKTTATSWGTVAESSFIGQHPKVEWTADAICDTGTTGQVQAVILDGTGTAVATGATHAVSGTGFTTMSEVLALPAGFSRQFFTFEVQAQVTGGTGNIYAQTLSLYGRQS